MANERWEPSDELVGKILNGRQFWPVSAAAFVKEVLCDVAASGEMVPGGDAWYTRHQDGSVSWISKEMSTEWVKQKKELKAARERIAELEASLDFQTGLNVRASALVNDHTEELQAARAVVEAARKYITMSPSLAVEYAEAGFTLADEIANYDATTTATPATDTEEAGS